MCFLGQLRRPGTICGTLSMPRMPQISTRTIQFRPMKRSKVYNIEHFKVQGSRKAIVYLVCSHSMMLLLYIHIALLLESRQCTGLKTAVTLIYNHNVGKVVIGKQCFQKYMFNQVQSHDCLRWLYFTNHCNTKESVKTLSVKLLPAACTEVIIFSIYYYFI